MTKDLVKYIVFGCMLMTHNYNIVLFNSINWSWLYSNGFIICDTLNRFKTINGISHEAIVIYFCNWLICRLNSVNHLLRNYKNINNRIIIIMQDLLNMINLMFVSKIVIMLVTHKSNHCFINNEDKNQYIWKYQCIKCYT